MNHKDSRTQREAIPDDLTHLARAVVDSAFCVHSQLGSGLLESVYEARLNHERVKGGIAVRRQVSMPVLYDNMKLEAGLRPGLIIGSRVPTICWRATSEG